MPVLSLSGYEAVTPFALFAPGGTPEAIVNRLNADIAQILKQAEVRRRFLAAGVEVVASTPAELGAMMRDDTVRMSKLVKSAGIRVE